MLSPLALAVTALAPEVRPPHQYDLQHVKLDVTLDFKREAIKGVVEHTLITTAKDATLAFDKGPMKIEKVQVDGKGSFAPETKSNHVIIKTKGVAKGATVKVRIAYSAEPEAGIYFVPKERAYPATTDLAYTQGEMEDNRYWFPVYDYPDDKASTELIARVPAGMSVLSNGKLVGTKTEGGNSVWHWKQSDPMATYLISLVAGKYKAVPDGTFKGKPIQIWAPEGAISDAITAFRGTDKLVSIYSMLTGIDYPWAKYAQSVVPEFMFGGMENLSCTTQTIGAIFPANTEGVMSSRGLNAHELAHQWFGDLITAKNWSHIWVNEGWATFMPHFVTRAMDGDSAYHIDRWGTYEGCKWSGKQNPMVRSDYTVPMEMFDGNAYPGGATRMFMLMKQLGETKFWSATKAYLAEYGYKNVTTEQFFESFAKTSNQKLDDFRKQWFYTKGIPSFSVAKVEGGYTVRQKTKGFDVDVEYVIMNNEQVTRRGVLGGTTSEAVKVPAGPDEILIVDPGAWVLCDISYPGTYKPNDFERAWTFADNDAQRMRLIDRVTMAFKKHEFEAPRSEALKQQLITRINDNNYLLDVVNSQAKPVIRASAFRTIFGGKGTAVESVVDNIFSTSTNEEMRNIAFDKLLMFRNDEATAQRGWEATTWNLSTKVAALNWFAANQPAKGREMALKAVREFAPGPVRMAAISALGRLKDANGSRDVFNLLIGLAKGRPYAPMDQAIGALADYGDKAAIPTLESREDHCLHFARGTVSSALARLKR